MMHERLKTDRIETVFASIDMLMKELIRTCLETHKFSMCFAYIFLGIILNQI